MIWPLHPKPYPDELLSSWLIRLAHANYAKVHNFMALYFGHERQIWTRDIDRLMPGWLVEGLSQEANCPTEIIRQLGLRTYEGILFERFIENGKVSGILPLGVYHRLRHRKSLQFCPACLSEKLYFRKEWRLSVKTVCTKHQIALHDSCPVCGQAVMPHRVDMEQRRALHDDLHIGLCASCGFDLRESEQLTVPDDLLELDRLIQHALVLGWVDFAGNPNMHSLAFFSGLSQFLKGLMKVRKRPSLLTIDDFPASDGFDAWEVADRRRALSIAAPLLLAWPGQFQDFVKNTRLRFSDLKGETETIPYWFWQEIKLHEMTRARFTPTQKATMYKVLSKRNEQVSLGTLTRITGRCFSRSAPIINSLNDSLSNTPFKCTKRNRRLTPDDFEVAMMEIDQEIGGEFDPGKRTQLLRKKFMFSLWQGLGLSYKQLDKLTLENLNEMGSVDEEISFFTEPRTRRQTLAWGGWFLRKSACSQSGIVKGN